MISLKNTSCRFAWVRALTVAAVGGRPVDSPSSRKVMARCKHKKTINHWCVSSLDAIAKNINLVGGLKISKLLEKRTPPHVKDN